MKKLLIFLIMYLLFISGCGPSVSFIKTGVDQFPLDARAYVKVCLEGDNPPDYEEIGLVIIRESQLRYNKVIIAAQKKAREVGGDIVIHKSKVLVAVALVSNDLGVMLYDFTFIIGKIK